MEGAYFLYHTGFLALPAPKPWTVILLAVVKSVHGVQEAVLHMLNHVEVHVKTDRHRNLLTQQCTVSLAHEN